ncbi:MAG TPA: SIMPL domain-containing protein [Vicinamibacterales bacterium]|nr:SIMPL domain-containing protein [Vicinamibacterales bacterium]
MTIPARVLVLIGVLVAPSAALAQSAPSIPAEPLVVTTGEGVVQAAPDRAWITIGAESRAATAKDAQQQNTAAMRPVQDRLRAAGVPADAIRTIGYDLQYEWDYVNGKRVGRGYVARNTIEVRVDDVSRVGDYLQIATESGATTLGGVRFDVKDRARFEREAIRLAVADARGKADAAAAGAGRSVDRIVRIDQTGLNIPVQVRPMFREAAAQAAPAPAPPIVSGEIEIRANVSLTAVLK